MIKNVGDLNQSLRGYDSKGWTKSADLNTEFSLPTSLDGVGEAENKSFGDFLTQSLGKVNDLQKDAEVAMQKLASGQSTNLHETMIAVEKADIAFKAMNQIRMKVIDAYREIMRMQV
ncbi:MAG: flagellar hook-basal body complex protein FliE [Bacteriovoracaceae bacterium]|nr:flagellar hook-basal body complex protein FliE [Bacteriovoracaceae bacterium]